MIQKYMVMSIEFCQNCDQTADTLANMNNIPYFYTYLMLIISRLSFEATLVTTFFFFLRKLANCLHILKR